MSRPSLRSVDNNLDAVLATANEKHKLEETSKDASVALTAVPAEISKKDPQAVAENEEMDNEISKTSPITFHPLPILDKNSDEPDDEIYPDSDIDDYIYDECLPVVEHPSFKSVDELGYYFDEGGKLKQKSTDEPYKLIKNKGDLKGNQEEYDRMYEAVTAYVYMLLEKEGLQRVTIPTQPKDDEATGFIFISEGALQKETVLVIVHGHAKIRAGQWSCKMIITSGLQPGTQLDYIRFGLEQKFGVMILNPNQNFIPEYDTIHPEIIYGSETALDHILYIWDAFFKDSPVKHIAFAAHGYGGLLISFLMGQRPESREKIFAVAFLDSCHSCHDCGSEVKEKLKECSVNWIRSNKPLDEVITNSYEDVQRSSGHEIHEWVPYSAKESAFNFIIKKYKEIL